MFSGWTSHLDLISLALTANGIQHTQLVGSMSRTQRSAALYAFAEDPTVMEPQYNPAAEAQAVDRVHRLGQKREVFITRFIMDNSFELKMVELQNKKRRLAELTTGKGKLNKAEEMKKSLEDLKDLFRR